MQSIKLPMMDHLVSQTKTPNQPILDAGGDSDANAQGQDFSGILQTEQKQNAEVEQKATTSTDFEKTESSESAKSSSPSEQPSASQAKFIKSTEPSAEDLANAREGTTEQVATLAEEASNHGVVGAEKSDLHSSSMTTQIQLGTDDFTSALMSEPVIIMADGMDDVDVNTLQATTLEGNIPKESQLKAAHVDESIRDSAVAEALADNAELEPSSALMVDDGLVQRILQQLDDDDSVVSSAQKQLLVDELKSAKIEKTTDDIDLKKILAELEHNVVDADLMNEPPRVDDDAFKASVKQAYLQASPLSTRKVVVDPRLIHEKKLQQLHVKIAAYTDQMTALDTKPQDDVKQRLSEPLISFSIDLIEAPDMKLAATQLDPETMVDMEVLAPDDILEETSFSPTVALPEVEVDGEVDQLLRVESEVLLTPELTLNTVAVLTRPETINPEVFITPSADPTLEPPDIEIDHVPAATAPKVSVTAHQLSLASGLVKDIQAKVKGDAALDKGSNGDDIVIKEVGLSKENISAKFMPSKDMVLSPDLKGATFLSDNLSAGPEGKSNTTAHSTSTSSTLYTPDKVMSMTMKLNHTQAQNVVSHQQMMQVVQDKFADMMRHHVMMMVDQGVKKAELRLDPPELGNMKIKINMQGEHTQVQFQVTQVQTRDLLEQSLPRLKEMLEQQGFSLADGHVNQESNQKGNREKDENNNLFQEDSLLSMDEFEAESDHLSVGIYKDGRVDFYA